MRVVPVVLAVLHVVLVFHVLGLDLLGQVLAVVIVVVIIILIFLVLA